MVRRRMAEAGEGILLTIMARSTFQPCTLCAKIAEDGYCLRLAARVLLSATGAGGWK